MKTTLQTLTIMLVIACISCDCMQRINVEVRDAETGQPLQNARVWRKGGDPKYARFTDSTGFAWESRIKGGFTCPPLKVLVAKKGYKTQKVTSVGHRDTTMVQLECLERVKE